MELPFIPSVRCGKRDQFGHVREANSKGLRRRIPSLEARDPEGLEDRTRISEGHRLRIRANEPDRIAYLGEILRRRPRTVLLEQGPQGGGRLARVRRPFA